MSENGSTGGMTLRERILALQDTTSEYVEVPEWADVIPGGKLEVRSMTGRQRATMLERFIDADGVMNVKDLYPSMIVASVFDPETGELLFTSEDYEGLNGKNAATLERLAQAAMRLSGISSGAQDQMGKDSSPTASGASTST